MVKLYCKDKEIVLELIVLLKIQRIRRKADEKNEFKHKYKKKLFNKIKRHRM